jgi:hypothetical protein
MFARMSARWAPLSMLLAIAFLIGNLEARSETVENVVRQSLFDAISGYEFPTDDSLTPIFKELGYSPKSPALWRSFPATRKLAALYGAAEAAVPGDGNRALAAVANKMSSRFDSLRNNRTVGDLMKAQDLSKPFKFSMDVPTTYASVPTETRGIIQTLSTYVEGGRLGGSYGILTRIFELDSLKAYSILADSNSVSEALMKGLGEVPQSEQTAKLKQLVTEAKAKYPPLAKAGAVTLFEASAQAKSPRLIDPDDEIVECMCGGRPIGEMPKSQCHVGMPCQ